MKPTRGYTIWFSQRTGSTLLNKALELTGVAGNPAEWLTFKDPAAYRLEDMQQMWQSASPNGVFGIKLNTYRLDEWLEAFSRELQLPEGLSKLQVWEAVFPECKHIYMTRRNKVRLAVSWWRAIVSGEWHREHGTKPTEELLEDKYNFDAINHLLVASTMYDAAIEAFFAESGIVPLTIVYEDFIRNYEVTVKQVLDFLEIKADSVPIAPPFYDQIADEIAESWVQRFRKERQEGWEHVSW